MGFLRRLFGGGRRFGDDNDGMYFYVRAHRSGEVIQVRIHRFNDLSLVDDGNGYFTRKVIVGTKSFDRLEAEFLFDRSRKFVSCEVTGGELAERDDYDAYLAGQASGSDA